ncbi:MAG: hypothetical protein R3264_03845, partial [Anaerolineae bacterium]|nr:hypothetical protein [Anaerolineae bacterium]
DRGISDLMTNSNPTVGLAAHAGQTDVRITAKADSETEAEALIAAMEAALRERLGVAIYGVEQETVAGVVGQLLVDRNLSLGVVDMLTGGQLHRDLFEAGFGAVINRAIDLTSPAAAWRDLGLQGAPDTAAGEGLAVAARLAEAVSPTGGLGLALIGPAPDENRTTFMALHGPGDYRRAETGRQFNDSDYVRRWLTIQGLDWVRRAVLGQLTSPVDW